MPDKPCLSCGASTGYPNGLCGPCYNMGIRGITPEGVIFSLGSLESWAEKTTLGKDLGTEWLQKVRDRVKALRPKDKEESRTLWERLHQDG